MNNKRYTETIALCRGAQNNKDVPNWTTLHEFDNTSKNKDFDAKVYKQGNRVVIAIAGTNIKSANDLRNDRTIFKGNIPSQYGDAERLYNSVKEKYGSVNIEFVGYSLGGTLANLLSHRTGLPSHAIAPIGSKHIADANKDYFKYDGSNITTYGRLADGLFRNSLLNKQQSGKIVLLPDLKANQKGYLYSSFENHFLHNFGKENFSDARIFNIEKLSEESIKELKQHYVLDSNSKIQATVLDVKTNLQNLDIRDKKIDTSLFFGWKNPISGDRTIYTKEHIIAMTPEEFEKHKKEIEIQAQKIGIPENKDMKEAQSRHGNVVHVKAYVRSSGVHVRDYYRSI